MIKRASGDRFIRPSFFLWKIHREDAVVKAHAEGVSGGILLLIFENRSMSKLTQSILNNFQESFSWSSHGKKDMKGVYVRRGAAISAILGPVLYLEIDLSDETG